MKRSGARLWLYGAPLLIWLLVIFMMSAQPYTKQDLKPWIKQHLSEPVMKEHLGQVEVKYGGRTISVEKNGAAGFVEFVIRKGAHLLVYMLLGMMMYRLLAYVLQGRSTYVPISLALVLCSLYAVSDEWHQRYTVSRTPMVADVLVDVCGAALGIGTAWLFMYGKRGRREVT